MSDHLFEHIEPLVLAAKGRTLSGSLPLSRLNRLDQLLIEAKGAAEVSLHFTRDEAGQPCVVGHATATLQLECQRCMQAMAWPVRVDFRLGIVTSPGAAEQLPDEYDPLLVTGEGISVADIVEDELILALPIVAMHETHECPAQEMLLGLKAEAAAVTEKENPFAVLAQLKKDSND